MPQIRTRPLMTHRQPAESLGCSGQVDEPVGCVARVYSDHSPLPVGDLYKYVCMPGSGHA